MDFEEKQISQDEKINLLEDECENEIQDSTSENEINKNSEVPKISVEEQSPEAVKKNSKKDDADQNFYNEILDKLDIRSKGKNVTSQEETKKIQFKNFNEVKSDNILKNQLERVMKQDFDKIQGLAKFGLINSQQEQNLKKQVLKKTFDKLVQTERIKRTLSEMFQGQGSELPRKEVFEAFNRANPDFFAHEGRKEVLNYLKTGKSVVGGDELNKISDIIRTVEKSAIDRYLQKAIHEKTLRTANETAKQRLTANAQNAGFRNNLLRTFTREQIGKMSGTEFAKYEPAIMDALKKGQIK